MVKLFDSILTPFAKQMCMDQEEKTDPCHVCVTFSRGYTDNNPLVCFYFFSNSGWVQVGKPGPFQQQLSSDVGECQQSDSWQKWKPKVQKIVSYKMLRPWGHPLSLSNPMGLPYPPMVKDPISAQPVPISQVRSPLVSLLEETYLPKNSDGGSCGNNFKYLKY